MVVNLSQVITIRRYLLLLTAAVIGLSLVAACGVSRSASEEDVLAEETDGESADDGSDSDDASDGDGEGETDTDAGEAAAAEAPEPTPPPTTAPDDEVAYTVDFGDDTFELTHGELNEVALPTWDNEEFITRAFSGAIPPGFYTGVANEFLIGEILSRELDELGGSVTETDTDESRESLIDIMASWYPEADDATAEADALYGEVPYLEFVVDLQATQSAVSNALADSGELDAEVPCVSHILVEEEATAEEVLGLLEDGGDFAELAEEYSTGPTGPNGGDLGCSPSDGYVPEFAAAVDSAEIGEFVGPVSTEFGWHVLVVDRLEETQIDPGQILNTRISAALESLSIEVDPRLGSWDENTLSIVSEGE